MGRITLLECATAPPICELRTIVPKPPVLSRTAGVGVRMIQFVLPRKIVLLWCLRCPTFSFMSPSKCLCWNPPCYTFLQLSVLPCQYVCLGCSLIHGPLCQHAVNILIIQKKYKHKKYKRMFVWAEACHVQLCAGSQQSVTKHLEEGWEASGDERRSYPSSSSSPSSRLSCLTSPPAS